MTKTGKIINTSNRSRIVKPVKTGGDLPRATGPTISVSADRDRAEPTTMKSVAAKLRRTKGSSGM